MGQVYLGFRSLLVKLAIFVVMAALLAWAIGGTLWPRTAVGIVGAPVLVDEHRIALVDRLRSDGNQSRFALALLDEQGEPIGFWTPETGDEVIWNDALSPVANGNGTRGAAAFGGDGRWIIVEFASPPGGGHPLQATNPVVRGVDGRFEAARALHQFAGAAGRSTVDGVESDTAGSSAG